MAISFSMTETLLICQIYILNCECLCKSIPETPLFLLTRPRPVLQIQLTVQPVTSQADSFDFLKGFYILFIIEYLFEFNIFKKNSFNLSQNICSINDTLGYAYSACEVTSVRSKPFALVEVKRGALLLLGLFIHRDH